VHFLTFDILNVQTRRKKLMMLLLLLLLLLLLMMMMTLGYFKPSLRNVYLLSERYCTLEITVIKQ